MPRFLPRRPEDAGSTGVAPAEAPDETGPLFASRRISRLWVLACMVAITVLVLVTFWPVLDAGFLNWDDNETVVGNPHFRGLGIEQIVWAFTTHRMGHYQPLSWLSLSVDHALWGLNPRGYHFTNLLLHLVNSLLVFVLLLGLARLATGVATSARPGLRVGVCGLCALLFAVHPMRVESVAWITERRDVLSALFLLLTVLAYIHARRPPRLATAWAWLAASLALFVASLLAKAVGVGFFLLLIGLDVYPLRRVDASSTWRAWRLVLIEKIPFVVFSIAATVNAALASTTASVSWSGHGLAARLVVAAYGWFYYLRKTLWPGDLSPLYELPVPVDLTEPRFLSSVVGILVVATLLAVSWRLRRDSTLPLLVLVVSYSTFLLPVLGLMQSGPQLVADRYAYLPSIALVGGLAILLVRVAQRRSTESRSVASRSVASRSGQSRSGQSRSGLVESTKARSNRLLELGVAFALVGLVFSFSLSARTYSQAWQSTDRLWEQALRSQPDCAFCREGLAIEYAAQGRDDDALREVELALEQRPALFKARLLSGLIWERRGEPRVAREHFLRAYQLDPRRLAPLERYAQLSAALGENRDAIDALEIVVRSSVPSSSAEKKYRLELAALLLAEGDCDQAKQWLGPVTEVPVALAAQLHDCLAK